MVLGMNFSASAGFQATFREAGMPRLIMLVITSCKGSGL
jgi:hypothetical protein